MTGCFGVKRKFPFKCDFGYFRAHKKVQWCERYKISYTGNILSISQAQIKIKQ